MITVAFMQNMWVTDPVRVERCIAQFGESYRRRLIHYALFAGCLSGQRLKATFGEDLCKKIIWEESSRVITGQASAAPPADPVHIATVLERFNPAVVLCFGRIACEAVPPLYIGGRLILAPHPAARQVATVMKLRDAGAELRALLAKEKAVA